MGLTVVRNKSNSMRRRFPVPGYLVPCLALALCAGAAQALDKLDPVLRGLPDLPSAKDTSSSYLNFGKGGAAMGYATRDERWGAKVDRFLTPNQSVTVDYGTLLTNKLGAGAAYTRRDALSEVVFNGVYAPQRNVRLRLTGTQLRGAGGFMPTPDDDVTVLQNSVLLNARKQWNNYLFLSDLGLTAYSAQANASSRDDVAAAAGRQDGYMLNLGMQPTARSRIELGREFGHLSYYLGEDARHVEELGSNRMKISHYLGNCVRFQGHYSASADTDRLDVKLSRNNWSVNLSHEQGGSNDNAIMIRYALPLDTRARRNHCAGNPAGAPTFESLVNASVSRPPRLSGEPLLTNLP
jgi:hypothetical protein